MAPYRPNRRDFLKSSAGVVGAAAKAAEWDPPAEAQAEKPSGQPAQQEGDYPRQFRGRQLQMISFPLGGVAAGSIGLGGRGQLRDWEIFNRPNKGYRPSYAFPAIWVQAGSDKPVAKVLESRILPPYEGQDGLGSANVPGLSRLQSATFTGEYPLAHIDFEDPDLPVQVQLEAFSPFIPHAPDDSGLPVAILRYRVKNSAAASAGVSIAFSIDNPIQTGHGNEAQRLNEYRSAKGLAGLLMSNPGLAETEPMAGTLAIAALEQPGARISYWMGWPQAKWWNAPLFFWDEFAAKGDLGEQPTPHNAVGVLCVRREIASGDTAEFTFLLGWRFANRTPEWCGWTAPPGEEKTIIGNLYATRFQDAWQAVSYTADHLEDLEKRTKMFVAALRESTLPAPIREAASANLSTLATTTCFRTADGEFHGFEGSDDRLGCCFGNCAHVWNYETVTPYLFPSFARSLRRAAFGYAMDEQGGIRFRQLLPDGKARFGYVAADGQMGQIIHAWLDWKLSGDTAWLRGMWPQLRKAVEFAWIARGWDPHREGVLTGPQHNTYDVEFYGPNPMCSIYYLGALRAAEEMARSLGEDKAAAEYRSIFERGRQWIDANLFNGSYYIQKVRGVPAGEIAPQLRGDMGASDPEKPEYQVGAGCLIDQLVGQYLADTGNLGALVSAENIQTTLRSIDRLNRRQSLADHDNVARTYALNDEAAVLVCDYGNEQRPKIPFPYFSEAWTGLEYTLAALMISWGMPEQGQEIVRNTRLRYDGEKRNPWDEAECGHHYARAMSAWSVLVAMSGFFYDGSSAAVTAVPRTGAPEFSSFWANANAWGTFSCVPQGAGTRFVIRVLSGSLRCRSVELRGTATTAAAQSGGRQLPVSLRPTDATTIATFPDALEIGAGGELQIDLK